MPRPTKTDKTEQATDLLSKMLVTEETRRTWFSIYGPRKHGKTTTALSISDKFAATGLTISERITQVRTGEYEPIVLDDIVIAQTDVGGSEASIDLGAQVPYVYDYNRMLEDNSSTTAMPMLIKAISAKHKDAKWLIIDTVSTLDATMLADNQAAGGNDTWAGYNFQLQAHRAVISALNQHWHGNVIFLCHARSLSDIDTASKVGKNQKKSRKATYGASPDIIPDITGKGASTYLNNSSLISVQTKRFDSKTKAWNHRMFSGNDLGYEGGSRFESIMLEMSGGDLSQGIDPTLYQLYNAYNKRFG